MFRRPPAPQQQELPPDVKALQARIAELEQNQVALKEIILGQQTAFEQIDVSLMELLETVPHLHRPTIQALLAQRIRMLARLPLGLHENDPKAQEAFEALTKYPAGTYVNAAMSATELLRYRVHSVVTLITKIASGENIGVQDVVFQGENDLEVLINHEKARVRRQQPQ
ncbi:hypothetical protein [Deinococcus ficus]|uniref:Uncharacterized protein n=1 Tax=Deinococcus ficus TaxID=317577 RepID=A0A221T2T3_9DEIO|nr:hypothetical protein [Deinococcus ficus]ASN83199.1 hypothetical protein DFI_18540 [Deinococcus ficus]